MCDGYNVTNVPSLVHVTLVNERCKNFLKLEFRYMLIIHIVYSKLKE
jgi:hypothetical protein